METQKLFKVRDFAEDFVSLMSEFGFYDEWSPREIFDYERGIEGILLIRGKKQKRGLKLILAHLKKIAEETDEYIEANRLKDFLMKWIKEELK